MMSMIMGLSCFLSVLLNGVTVFLGFEVTIL